MSDTTNLADRGSGRSVWVGCLACYNAGNLVGSWLDPAEGPDWACPNPTHEETWVFDHEGFGSEGEGSPQHFADLASEFEEAAEYGPVEAYLLYRANVGAQYATAAGFEESYRGEWGSLQEYAEELFDELYLHEIPEHLRSYIDYEKFASDLECDGYWEADGYVFEP